MTPNDDTRDALVKQEEEAAAAQAGRIGGRAPDGGVDPVREAGGGEAEGFEEAEELLVSNAEHGEGTGIPRPSQMGEEAEPDRATYGEADEEDVTEVVRDPSEPPDDPGRGPGIAAER
jgi:hypothetical protein